MSNWNDDERSEHMTFDGKRIMTIAAVAAVSLCIVIVALFGLIAGAKAFSRYQRLADERNQIQVNDIQIAQTAQLVKVEQQKAQIRVVNAQGLADSQKIINSSLTNQYLQYEAIQAELQMVSSPNHTVIYIPVGDNGIPLVGTTNPTESPSSGK